jgi:transcriptional regulator with XRE-family HTH domain
MNTIQERIKFARESAGLKKADLVRAVGVSAPTISDWESGKIKNIEGANLLKLANALKVTPEWLQTGKETRQRTEPTPMIAANDDPRLAQDSDEAMLLRIFREMTDEQRGDILKNATDTHETNERLLAQLLARKKA